MKPIDGDLAARVARQLQYEHVDEFLKSPEEIVDLESPMVIEARKSMFAKIKFEWRSSDNKILEQIRAGIDGMMRHMYDDMKKVVDEFYAQTRDPEVDPETGLWKRDSRGRVIWKKDSNGKDVENWSLLTGQDIDKTLFNITLLKLDLAPRVNALLNEAVFAKHIADDAFQDAYQDLLEGTVKDREAHAARKSREDKYHAFFRYYLWSQADAFMKELNAFTRVLERVRYWRIDEGGKTSP